jgi:hypothetical protein
MSHPRSRRLFHVGLAAGASVLVFAALALVGAAVSPSATPAASQQYAKKVTICHFTGSKKNPYRTIRVGRSAVKAHLRHGDALGKCSTASLPLCHKLKHSHKHVSIQVKGSKRATKHIRHGDKAGKCKVKKKHKKK